MRGWRHSESADRRGCWRRRGPRMFSHTLFGTRYRFRDLKHLLATASPLKSGDVLAGLAADSAEHRVAARLALAELPLATFLQTVLVPYELDEVTRLIVDTHDAAAFEPVSHLTVGGLRDWLLAAAPEAGGPLAPPP